MARKSNAEVVQAIEDVGVIACMKDEFSKEKVIEVAGTLLEVGAYILEFTMNSKDPITNLKALKEQYGEQCVVGMGTVLSVEEAQIAIDAGADFIMGPCFDEEIFQYVNSKNVCMIPGVFTASEAFKAHKAGAEVLKLFPVGHIGIEYLHALRGPLNHYKFFCDGKVPYAQVKDYIAAGAVGCGQMSGLLGDGTDSMDVVKKRTIKLLAEIKEAKKLRT